MHIQKTISALPLLRLYYVPIQWWMQKKISNICSEVLPRSAVGRAKIFQNKKILKKIRRRPSAVLKCQRHQAVSFLALISKWVLVEKWNDNKASLHRNILRSVSKVSACNCSYESKKGTKKTYVLVFWKFIVKLLICSTSYGIPLKGIALKENGLSVASGVRP